MSRTESPISTSAGLHDQAVQHQQRDRGQGEHAEDPGAARARVPTAGAGGDRRAGRAGRGGRRRCGGVVAVTSPPGACRRRGPGDRVENGEGGEQAAPRPAVGGGAAERRLERPGGADEHGRQHGEEQQGEQRLAHPQAADQGAVQRTGGGHRNGGGQAGGDEQPDAGRARRRRGSRPRRRAAPRAPAARPPPPAPCRRTRRPGRAPRAAARPGRRRPRRARRCGRGPAGPRTAPSPSRGRGWPARARPRSGSSANANSSEHQQRRTARPGCMATRLRASMRRSRPATRRGVTPHGSPRGGGAGASGRAGRHPPCGSDAVADRRSRPRRSASASARSSSWDDSTTVAPWSTAWRTRPSSRSRASLSSPAWGSSSSHSSGRRASRQASEVRRRWPADSRATGTSRSRPSSPTRSIAASMSPRAAPVARPQNVTLSATVRSSNRPVAWASSPTRRRTGAGVDAQVVAEHPCLAAHHRHEARQRAQERGLACAVRAAEEDDLAARHVEVDPGERRESSEQRNGGAEVDDRLHGDDARLLTQPFGPPRPGGAVRPPRHLRERTGVVGSVRSAPDMRLARVLGAIGRVCITAGVLILLFVVYQLWGTGIREAQAQNALEDEFERAPRRGRRHDPDRRPRRSGGRADRPPRRPRPRPHRPRATPSPSSASPPSASTRSWSRASRSATSSGGRATTPTRRCPASPATPPSPATAPPTAPRSTGSTSWSRATRSSSRPSRARSATRCSDQLIVSPDQVEVLDDFGDNRLTLTACHPKYSARQRIVVVASLVGEAAAAPDDRARRRRPGQRLGHRRRVRRRRPDDRRRPRRASAPRPGRRSCSASPAPSIWIAAWLLGKLWRKWPAYLVGLPLFLVVLFFFFENFSRLLPANF